MEALIKKIETYWDQRSSGYCQVNLDELNSFKRDAWMELISEYYPVVSGEKLRVLDVGTGPGFFALLMADCGHEVTAIDYTEAMLEKAAINANRYNHQILFKKMDAHSLDFEDNIFDLIITRNLTWNLERPDKVYQEFYRVLAKGGRLLNFDANWYLHLHDPEKREGYERDRLNTRKNNMEDHYTCTDTKAMEQIAMNLPLSREHRPEWDTKELIDIGFRKIVIELGIGDRVWNETEKVNYSSTPMFMIGAEK